MTSITDKNLKSEINFGAEIIDNIFDKKSDPVPRGQKLNESEKEEFKDLTEAAMDIAGLGKPQKNIEKAQDLYEDVELYFDRFPEKIQEKISVMCDRIEKYENYMKKAIDKYRKSL